MHDFINSISYLERLKRRREEIKRQKEATPKPPTLEQRIEAWFNGLIGR